MLNNKQKVAFYSLLLLIGLSYEHVFFFLTGQEKTTAIVISCVKSRRSSISNHYLYKVDGAQHEGSYTTGDCDGIGHKVEIRYSKMFPSFSSTL